MSVMRYSENNSNQIVIVEDSPTQAEQLKYLLEKHNYKVIVAKDGQEALGMVVKHGGRIWAESEVDRGSTFAFTLKKGSSTKNEDKILLTKKNHRFEKMSGGLP